MAWAWWENRRGMPACCRACSTWLDSGYLVRWNLAGRAGIRSKCWACTGVALSSCGHVDKCCSERQGVCGHALGADRGCELGAADACRNTAIYCCWIIGRVMLQNMILEVTNNLWFRQPCMLCEVLHADWLLRCNWQAAIQHAWNNSIASQQPTWPLYHGSCCRCSKNASTSILVQSLQGGCFLDTTGGRGAPFFCATPPQPQHALPHSAQMKAQIRPGSAFCLSRLSGNGLNMHLKQSGQLFQPGATADLYKHYSI